MASLQIKSNKKFLLLLIISAAIINFSFLEYNNYQIQKNNPGNIEKNARIRMVVVFLSDKLKTISVAYCYDLCCKPASFLHSGMSRKLSPEN